jgi:hypothetical protein
MLFAMLLYASWILRNYLSSIATCVDAEERQRTLRYKVGWGRCEATKDAKQLGRMQGKLLRIMGKMRSNNPTATHDVIEPE